MVSWLSHQKSTSLFILLALVIVLLLQGCKPGGMFSSRSPHEAYFNKLKEAGLHATNLGTTWSAAAASALSKPLQVTLPYQEQGFFAAEKPTAAGISFQLKRGQKLLVRVDKRPASGAKLFIDLFNSAKDRLASADTATSHLEHEVDEDGTYVLRLHPELFVNISYNLTITTQPSLAFPVKHKDARIGSFWGADRDAGARRHEGIDIFAPKRAAAVAAADGRVTSVADNRLGGKVVFMRPAGKNYTLYYAHLDEQLVSAGDKVYAGDTLGLVGNTGNARSTPPHLHFGIYASGGAINPLPFVEKPTQKPPAVKSDTSLLSKWVRTSSETMLRSSTSTDQSAITLNKHQPVYIISAYDGFYKVASISGQQGFISSKSLQPLTALQTIKLNRPIPVYHSPDTSALLVTTLSPPISLQVLARSGEYLLTRHNDILVWFKQE